MELSNRICDAIKNLVCEKDLKMRGRRSSTVTTSDNITVIRWMDKNAVHMISSFSGKKPQDTIRRWNGAKVLHRSFSA